jgi:phosphate/sulfate permease
MRVIPIYYALTASILTLFIVVSGGHGVPTLEQMSTGKAIGIILGVFFAVMVFSAIFFVPYYYRKLVKEDRRIRIRHLPMGPLLWKDDQKLYFPGSEDGEVVPDYYRSDLLTEETEAGKSAHPDVEQKDWHDGAVPRSEIAAPTNVHEAAERRTDERRAKDLATVDQLPWAHPKRIFVTVKLILMYGLTRDVIGHQSRGLNEVHKRAPQYDNKVEHLWTTAQVCSAMIMSISQGANDVSNAIGPFTTEYETWISGVASSETDTPTWIKAIGGLGLGFGFWTFGYHIMRKLGNKVTKHTPTRGYSMELAAAITVLLASRLGLPVSTTQCITCAIVGVALTTGDVRSINWRQFGKIFLGWFLTLPAAGLIVGILMGMSLNAPHLIKP